SGAVVEVLEIQPEAAVVLDVDEMLSDEWRVPRLPVGREPHDLVLAGVDLEPRVVGEGRIEQPERMGKVNLAYYLDVLVHAQRERRRGPLSHTVHRENRGAVEGRWEERARGVAQVVFREYQPILPVDAAVDPGEFRTQQVLLEELLLEPHRQCSTERGEAVWRQRHVSLEQTVELEK